MMKQEIEKIKKRQMKALKKSVEAGDVHTIVLHTKIVEDVEYMLNRYIDLENSFKHLENKIKSFQTNKALPTESFSTQLSDSAIQDKPLSNREIGALKRHEFVRDIKLHEDFTLLESKGAIFSTNSREAVGIAYASERQQNRWFLGLPDSDYYAFVLLCQPKIGGMKRFILPRDFYQRIRNHLSEKNNQLKFNVSKRKSRYYLSIPNMGNIDISDYLENYVPFEN